MKFNPLLGIKFRACLLKSALNLLALRALRFVLAVAPYSSLAATFYVPPQDGDQTRAV